jgi:hypothetical protein
MVDQKSCRVRKSGHVVRGSLVLPLVLAALGLQGVSAGFVDMDTPFDKRTTTSFVDGSTYHLVSLCWAAGREFRLSGICSDKQDAKLN